MFKLGNDEELWNDKRNFYSLSKLLTTYLFDSDNEM